MKRCKVCIMPDTVRGIEFDEDGCTYCKNLKWPPPLGEKAFLEIIKSVKPGRDGHDCIVPVSGGRDSSFVLYLAKEIYGMNPLAVNHDNEFRNPQAVKNMERASRALGTDLCVVRSKRNIGTQFVRANAMAAIPMGLPYLPLSFCRQCDYGYHSAVYIETEKRGIPLILWGDSEPENTGYLREFSLIGLNKSRWNKIVDFNLYKTEWLALRQHMEFPVKGNSLFHRSTPKMKNPNVREVLVFDYLQWDRKTIKKIIAERLGWEKPEGHATSWRTDCLLHEVVNFFFAKAVGLTNDGMGFCNMIKMGHMTRDVALKQEYEGLRVPWEHIEKILSDHVGIRPKHVARIKDLQARSPYPLPETV